MGAYEKRGAALLAEAKIEINGPDPWDMRMKHPETVFRKIISGGTLAFCETYMDGEWECDDMLELLCRILGTDLQRKVLGIQDVLLYLRAKLVDLQSPTLSRQNIEKHYDHGNDFYRLWLDESMTYSSALWAGDVKTLDEAQAQKLDHIARKLKLEPGMHVLDIGSGWGGLAYHLAAKYGAKVVGLTLSKRQAALATQRCRGLAEFRVEDYRDHKGTYDRIVSVGMVEHVGRKHFPEYMQFAHRLLDPSTAGGLFLCHGIVNGNNRLANVTNPFVRKYIFPGGEIGSVWELAQSAQGAGFVVEDWEAFGHGYYRTCRAWHDNFVEHEAQIRAQVDDNILRVFGTVERFVRAWRDLYLLGSAANFRVRNIDVGQLMLSKDLAGHRYEGVRF